MLLKDLGDLAGARKCLERALKIFTQFLPENHPNIKMVRGNLEGVEGLQRTLSQRFVRSIRFRPLSSGGGEITADKIELNGQTHIVIASGFCEAIPKS
jgi:hypothetical protein